MKYDRFSPQSHLSIFARNSVSEGPPGYKESPLYLRKPLTVFNELEKIDWSFTKDDTRFLAHDLHPYPAKFIPQIPGNLIARLSTYGELVYDPFGGSGTTALEAIRLGRRAISSDANPISAIIGKVKTARIDLATSKQLHSLHSYLTGRLEGLPAVPADLVKEYEAAIPVIANREKWFPDTSLGELALVRSKILELSSSAAQEVALLALSKSVLSVSFQDSETRYKSTPKEIPSGVALRKFLKEFEFVMLSVAENSAATRYGISRFLIADARTLSKDQLADCSVDLIVTSPPYGNATDYHLYHRFRLLWLGYDPVALGKVEIGSHLKHQREKSGFDSYFSDMIQALESIHRVLKPGRYAALVIGDSIYKGESYDTAILLAGKAKSIGFSTYRNIEREIHSTRRSFVQAGRRAENEHILVLRKSAGRSTFFLGPPNYKLWHYEKQLRYLELGLDSKSESEGEIRVEASAIDRHKFKKLSFSHAVIDESGNREPTWQAILENGTNRPSTARKDPKYVTHGLHTYKGKFYPQLAKSLINTAKLPSGARVLDPFCGSGTTLLEAYLNGYRAYGCDVNPIAAKIASAKTAILDVEPDLFTEVISNVISNLRDSTSFSDRELDQFSDETHEELARWFPEPVLYKLDWLLREIRRTSSGSISNFLEVVLSSVIREVSQQEPADLRIRYRKKRIKNADVFGLFERALETQYKRLEKFWSIRGYAPSKFYPACAITADNREWTSLEAMGLGEGDVDLVLTSPPYAMALPYIDTDRLSLLALLGLESSNRKAIEQTLIGSREITNSQRKAIEDSIDSELLPQSCIKFVRELAAGIDSDGDAGFRKKNMPSLVLRFLRDMQAVLSNTYRAGAKGSEAMIVIGDSKMTVNGNQIRIPTTDLIEDIGQSAGYKTLDRIDITVTTENMLHQKNAITENVVLWLGVDK